MFHGGTNFGFINGAINFENHRGVVTSYGKCLLVWSPPSIGGAGGTKTEEAPEAYSGIIRFLTYSLS